MSKALAAIARAKSDQLLKETSDAEASISSHESDDESYGLRKLKKEPQESVFEENGARNGMISSQRDTAETSLNGSQGLSLKEGLEDGALGRGLPPGYQTYSSEHKQEVINYAKETTVREAARKYCVPRSTVQVWCKHGTGVKKEKRSPVGGGRRLSYSSETDDKLLQWVIKEQENGTPVTKDAIQLQARNLVRDECPDFKASSGWVEKFMSRHNLAVATTMSSTNTNETIPISYVVASPASAPSPLGGNHSSYSPRGDGRSCTSEDTRSESGRSDEEDDIDDGAASMENMAAPISQSVIREPPNLSEILKTSGLSGSASSGLKDEDDDDGEGDDGDGDVERGESGAVNPERLKAFNMFVRLFVDENLDRLVPISKQPKEKILAIIQSCQRQFPEFRDRARKRIRTYLKSCRRLKKLKEPLKRTADQMNILASACASEVENSKRPRLDTDTPATPPVTTTNMTATCMSVTSPAIKSRTSSQCQLSPSEIQAIRHLIQGYRESAAFLYRSADELEQLLPPP